MADDVVDRVHHPVGDVIDRAGAGLRRDARRMRERGLFAAGRDEMQVGHGGEHDVRPLFGAVEIARRRQPRRRLHQAGEQGRFRQAHILGVFAEIALRGLLDAVGAGAEIDAVEIELEYLRLGEFALQPDREHRLLQLAMDGALLRQEKILRQLLRDGGGALRHAAVQDIGDERARDAVRIDAVMLVEAAILDGDESLRHVARQFLQRQHGAAAVAAGGKRAAMHVDDLDRGRPLGNFQRLDRRQMRAGPGNRADAADNQPERQHQAPINGAADQRTFARALARFARAFAPRGRLAGAAPAGGNAQFGRAVEHRFPARVRLSPSRHHATRLEAHRRRFRRSPQGKLECAV